MTEQNTKETGMFTRHKDGETMEEHYAMVPPNRKLALHSKRRLGMGLVLVEADLRYTHEGDYDDSTPDCKYLAIAREKGESYDRVYASVIIPTSDYEKTIAYLVGRLDGYADGEIGREDEGYDNHAAMLLKDASESDRMVGERNR